MPQNVYFRSLGCPKNLVDTESMSGSMLGAGWGLTFDPAEAGVWVINTCAFLPSAREEAFKAIREAARWKKRAPKQGRRIVVAGCLTAYDRSVRADFPEVDLWLPIDQIPQLPELLAGTAEVEEKKALPTYLCDEKTPRLQLTAPHVAYLKICDGCDNCCSYCAIPHLRGRLRSRSQESVVAEAKNLLKNGVKEIVLIAQDITAFGHDRGEKNAAAALLRALDALDGDFVVRLLYTHPAHYTDEFIDAVAEGKHILHYLDIPLQHSSDRILKSMNRHIGREGIDELLGKLRFRIPDLVIRTTFIVGFPGETEEDVKNLSEFLERWKFERCGFFAYAAEDATPSAKFEHKVSAYDAQKRLNRLMAKQEKRMKAFQKAQAGRKLRAIVDVVESGVAYCRTYLDAPEIDYYTLAPASGKLSEGAFCELEIENISEMDTTAILAGNKK